MIQRRWLLDDLPFPCQTFSVFLNGKSNWIGTVGTVIDYLHLEEVICLWRWKPAIAKILINQMRNREEFQTHEWYHYHDHVDSSYIGSFVLSQGTLGMEKKVSLNTAEWHVHILRHHDQAQVHACAMHTSPLPLIELPINFLRMLFSKRISIGSISTNFTPIY